MVNDDDLVARDLFPIVQDLFGLFPGQTWETVTDDERRAVRRLATWILDNA